MVAAISPNLIKLRQYFLIFYVTVQKFSLCQLEVLKFSKPHLIFLAVNNMQLFFWRYPTIKFRTHVHISGKCTNHGHHRKNEEILVLEKEGGNEADRYQRQKHDLKKENSRPYSIVTWIDFNSI